MSVEEIENCIKGVADTKEWFEEDGFIAGLDEIEGKIRNVTSLFTKAIFRMDKYKRLFASLDRFEKEVNETYNNATNLLKYKPWINDSYNSNFSTLYTETVNWYAQFMSKYHLQNFTQDPTTSPEILDLKVKRLKSRLRDLNRIPMPKLPQAEVPSNKTISNETTSENRTFTNETTSSTSNQTETTNNETSKTEGLKTEEL
jgi:hypothetical protein